MADTIFAKIIRREIPATIVYEDEQSLAFRDIHPQAPVHILIVPKLEIAQLSQVTQSHKALLGHLLWVAQTVAKQEGVQDHFRLVINNGTEAGQTVFHLHLHLLAGREFYWPPG